jgi:hypothetical protein
MAGLAQGGGQGFRLGAGAAVDDAGLAAAGGGELQHLTARAVLGGEGEVNVGPVETAQENPRGLATEQAGDDFVAGFLVGGGGEGGKRHAQSPAQGPDAQIVGAEIMPPLRDAMGLVHRDQRGADAAQKGDGAGRGQPLGRHVEQAQAAGIERGENPVCFLFGIARGECPGLDPGGAQGAHLIAHQGNQRRDDDGDALAHQGGQLVAQGLAAAGGHDGQRVAPLGHRLHDFSLPGAEGIETEYG